MGYELHPLPMRHDERSGADYAVINGERIICESAWYVEKVGDGWTRREYWARSRPLGPGRLMYVEAQPDQGET